MVSTEKCYETNNFSVLECVKDSGEWFYRVCIYAQRAPYLSADAGIIRMRVLLGFIESRSVVIDATIKSEGTLQYLSIICASGADPVLFSRIMSKTAPGAILEELSPEKTSEYVTASALRKENSIPIPRSSSMQSVMESRTVLLSLLIEYRALIAECKSFIESDRVSFQNDGLSETSSNLTIPFLFFEVDGIVHGIPEFQIESMSLGGGGQHIIHVAYIFGPRVVLCDDILTVQDVDIVHCQIQKKIKKGYYEARVKNTREAEKFVLVVPSFL
ncbi:MAG TPA: hypothetical protein GXZ47_08410 [Treponema sp.]|nr:hypothetical protein [Treponema sp.]